METRANHVLVGSVVLFLLAAVIFAAFWFSRIGDAQDKIYDIHFQQSVSGVNKGSGVYFAGVPVGQVKEIELWKRDPSFVRMRIAVKTDTPILEGTTAMISGVGFTGVSEIQLEGAVKGARPLACPSENSERLCPDGVPVIPTKAGGLGALLNNAPQLLDRLTTLTTRLTELLNDRNQASIGNILRHLDDLSGELSARGPEIAAVLAEARLTVERAGIAIEEMGKLAGTTNAMLSDQGRPLMADLRKTVQSAQKSIETLEVTIGDARPGLQAFSKQTIPEIGVLIHDLREMSRSIRSVAEKLDQQGAGSIVGSPKLPDYKK